MVFLKLLIEFRANFGVNHCVFLEAHSSIKMNTSADVLNISTLSMGSIQPLPLPFIYKNVNIPQP